MNNMHGYDNDSIKAQREKLGLTQKDLAELAGISISSLRNIEQGRAQGSFNVIARIALVLNNYAEHIFDPALKPMKRAKTMAASRLIARRAHLGWTQRKLANIAQVGIHTIRNIEQGHSQPGPIIKHRLAVALGVTVVHLWGVEVGPYLKVLGPVAVYRVQNGLTRAALARKMGVGISTLIKLEQNNLYLNGDTYERAADFLGLTGKQLLTEMTNASPKPFT